MPEDVNARRFARREPAPVVDARPRHDCTPPTVEDAMAVGLTWACPDNHRHTLGDDRKWHAVEAR